MGFVDNQIAKIPGTSGLLTRQVAKPTYKENDFVDGFQIREDENGQPKDGGANDVYLIGPFMPHQPFKFGGEQRLLKDYYPGNSEPAVQVLGPKETDLSISGELKLKKFKRTYSKTKTPGVMAEDDVRSYAENYQRLIDAMRIRGNLVELVMGKWHRWGFIEKVEFELNTMASIKYQIDFFIVGFNKPLNTKISSGFETDLIRPNSDLTAKALTAIAKMQNYPSTMPRSVSDFLNGEIAKVAGAIKLVTNFVNEALQDIENINQSFNRALGLINNARAVISQSARRLNAVATDLGTLGSRVQSQWGKTVATLQSVNHIHQVRYNYGELTAIISVLQTFIELQSTKSPLVRVPVRTGDSLQKFSNRFYNTPTTWRSIYDYNKLTTTNLQVGSVLQIPKL